MFPRQVFGLYRLKPTSRTSRTKGSVSFGVRTCLPLRGSSGVSPDSLFTSVNEGPRNSPTIYCANRKFNRNIL
jgi:hypothetical protein